MIQTYRINEYYLPKHYNLTLSLDRLNRSFTGSVVISGHKRFDSHPIFLHAKDLTLTQVTINGEAVRVTPMAHDANRLDADLPAGDYDISISFSGEITDGMHGMYPCYYEHKGSKKELLVTQFESHHAREVFPCIDEPEAKATFDLTLITEPGVTVLSNMPVVQSSTQDRMSTRFATTPRMSTYLLAFVVGELHASSGLSKNGTKVSVYSTPSQTKSSHSFALKEAIAHLDFLEDYFGTKFPLEKCDHVALPDFSALAMENWGLITYREGFLVSRRSTSVDQKQYISSVIAHELAHQWFGNLVTMRWWNDLWLNESFANLMQYVSLAHIHPSWHAWENYTEIEMMLSLGRDQYASVQPVAYSVKTPEMIAMVFDRAILYAKGSRLLRMAMEHIGEEHFKKGLQRYFKDFAYGNTDGADLWRSLAHVSGKRIETFMETWLTHAGLPVVHVESTHDGYTLTQHRFALGHHGVKVQDTIWPIPLAAEDAAFPHSLNERSVTVKKASSPRLNIGNVSHFVTAYDTKAFTYMREQVARSKLSIGERCALLYETHMLAQSRTYDTARLIQLLPLLAAEPNSSLWTCLGAVIDSLGNVFGEGKYARDFERYVRDLAKPQLEKIGLQAKQLDSLNTLKLRSRLAELLVKANDTETIAALAKQFGTSESHDADMLYAGYMAVVQLDNPEELAALTAQFKQTEDAHLRIIIIRALATSPNKPFLRSILPWLQDQTIVKAQDLPWVYASLLQNPIAREMTWNWLIEHWSYVSDLFEGDKTLDKFVSASASVMNTRDWFDRYKEFFDTHTTNAIKRTIDMGKDEISSRLKWQEAGMDNFVAAIQTTQS